MSESMVERVAKALFAGDGLKHAASNVSLDESWEMSPQYHEAYRRKARAAIEAMREPNEQMLGAGEPFADHPDWAWQAMIDDALKEG